MANSPKKTAQLKFKYRHEHFVGALNMRYVSEMLPQWDFAADNGDGTFGARIGDAVDPYYVLDFNVRREAIYKGLYVNFKVNNLFDAEVRYPNNTFSSEILNRGTLDPGRSVLFTVGLAVN